MSPTSQSSSLQALLSLMSDPDPQVWSSIERQLVKRGEKAMRFLRETAEKEKNTLVRLRARAVLAQIHEMSLTNKLKQWLNPGGTEPDLEEGWFLLTELEFPNLDVAHYRRKLDDMAADIDLRLRGAKDMDALRAFQKYIHFDMEFRGNVEGYHQPENSYINCVLDRRVGIPISLSSIYLLIARRVGLPIEGIAAPGHFLLRFRRDRTGREPLYLDPFHGGRHLTQVECLAFLRSKGHYVQNELEMPAGAREILARMCRNLIANYGDSNPDNSGRLIEWLDIISAGIPGPGSDTAFV